MSLWNYAIALRCAFFFTFSPLPFLPGVEKARFSLAKYALEVSPYPGHQLNLEVLKGRKLGARKKAEEAIRKKHGTESAKMHML